MAYYLYKGLKKPLILFGLKDKYIFQAMGIAALGLVTAGLLPNLIGFFGVIVGIAIAGGGIWYIFQRQDTKGLYSKTKNDNEIHIFPSKIKLKKIRKI